MSVKVDGNDVLVTVAQDVTVDSALVTNTIANEYPNTITVKSNEFAVVGDGLFATTKEEVPGWMRELVGDLARGATANAYNAMTGFNYNLYNAMIALQVAENKYQQAINTRVTDQEAFVQAVETLNSTVQNAEAEIVGIKQTYATKDFATATVAQTLEASLNGGAIKSSLGQLASTMTNQYGTMAQRMDVLESTFDDLGSNVQGYANATSGLETFVGKNASNTNAPVITSSKFYQDLDVYLAGTDYTVGGTNTLVNQVTAAATGVESKFAYNSNLMLNGTAYNSGFGLATSLTPGSNIPVGDSEFWINADKFKLTTTGYSGTKYSPFTVDGTNGKITFTGVVDFTSTNASGTTTIDGSKITTGTITAGAIAAGSISVMDIAAGGVIQSSPFVSGSQGWRITKEGDAEFNSLKIRAENIASGNVTKTTNIPNFNPGTNITNYWNSVGTFYAAPPDTGNGGFVSAFISLSGYRTEGSVVGLSARLIINGSVVTTTSSSGSYFVSVTLAGGLGYKTTGAVLVSVQVFSDTPNDGICNSVSGVVWYNG